jgi:putative oxidoreductase
MSASSRALRGVSDRHVVGTTSGGVPTRRAGLLHRLVATDNSLAGTVARLALGLVMFPHGAQKMLGWFGGYGFSGTYTYFTTGPLGLPGVIAAAVIFIEFVGSIALIFGALTRLAALGMIAIMLGAIITTHLPNGFFMNWTGKQAGEGFEYHLLVIALAIVTLIIGAGAMSVDRSLTKGRDAT